MQNALKNLRFAGRCVPQHDACNGWILAKCGWSGMAANVGILASITCCVCSLSGAKLSDRHERVHMGHPTTGEISIHLLCKVH